MVGRASALSHRLTSKENTMKKLLFIPLLAVAACATVDYSDEGIKERVAIADRECGHIGYTRKNNLDCKHDGYRQITGAAIADAQARNRGVMAGANLAVGVAAAGGL